MAATWLISKKIYKIKVQILIRKIINANNMNSYKALYIILMNISTMPKISLQVCPTAEYQPQKLQASFNRSSSNRFIVSNHYKCSWPNELKLGRKHLWKVLDNDG
jgi:hypothetical protein